MREATKHTDDEEKIVPRPEGYTIVKCAKGWAWFTVFVGGPMISTLLLCVFRNAVNHRDWLIWGIFIIIPIILWVIMRKITEVKVNLIITDEGLEQTRISGSKLYPKRRMIRWEEMKSYCLNGRNQDNNFLISVKDDVNFRIYISSFPLFEKQENSWENFVSFRKDFSIIATEHDVHRAFMDDLVESLFLRQNKSQRNSNF